ncbi:hypothetical protein PR003_g25016 [Phytophthora rubi]|uniref:Uncharacterized protein n=1 Tax=Phytophthora rubi TaxID=129364 RepID=A0A6A4CT32_9STRA|nr:hypothetical protein PR003_g25016 [Phytophthora rubi]
MLCRRGVGVGSVFCVRGRCVDAVLVLTACTKDDLRAWTRCWCCAWTLCRRGVGVGSVYCVRGRCVDAGLVLEACTKERAPRTYNVCGGGVGEGGAACVDAVLLVKEVLRAWTLCWCWKRAPRTWISTRGVREGRAACVDAVLVLTACTKDELRVWTRC